MCRPHRLSCVARAAATQPARGCGLAPPQQGAVLLSGLLVPGASIFVRLREPGHLSCCAASHRNRGRHDARPGCQYSGRVRFYSPTGLHVESAACRLIGSWGLLLIFNTIYRVSNGVASGCEVKYIILYRGATRIRAARAHSRERQDINLEDMPERGRPKSSCIVQIRFRTDSFKVHAHASECSGAGKNPHLSLYT